MDRFVLILAVFLTGVSAISAYGDGRAADVLVGVHINGEESRAWWDPGPTYETALLAGGANTVDVIYAPEGGPIPFPNPFKPTNFPVCVVLTGENWLAPPRNFGPTEEAALSDYCDAGGAVMIVGQDLLFGAHNSWGSATGFFETYMGLSYVDQDMLVTSNSVAWSGEAGGPLAGVSGVTTAGDPWPPFLANGCQADDLTPVAGAGELLSCTAGGSGPYTTGIYYDRAPGRTLYRSCFIAFEPAAAADPDKFNEIIDDLYDWLTSDESGVEPASLGKLKAVYR
ncbi:MAG: hypothetical protein JSW52_00380 [Candidatus Coatesbacteria bacterium]|nr:MAG: hypothetical protein JSW52_00380 [Candidatus Coatesbacteria bacterium]